MTRPYISVLKETSRGAPTGGLGLRPLPPLPSLGRLAVKGTAGLDFPGTVEEGAKFSSQGQTATAMLLITRIDNTFLNLPG